MLNQRKTDKQIHKNKISWAWGTRLVIIAPGRKKQEEQEFKVLSYTLRLRRVLV